VRACWLIHPPFNTGCQLVLSVRCPAGISIDQLSGMVDVRCKVVPGAGEITLPRVVVIVVPAVTSFNEKSTVSSLPEKVKKAETKIEPGPGALMVS